VGSSKRKIDPLLSKLKGGDLRSIGNSDKVVILVAKNPHLLGVLFEQGIFHPDPVVRARSADADVAEKVARSNHEYLQPYKEVILNEASKIDQQEVRWHVAQMFSYLNLDESERRKAVALLYSWIDSEDKSNIVKVFSLQVLADLASQDHHMRSNVRAKLREMMETGSPSLKSRSRKLLREL